MSRSSYPSARKAADRRLVVMMTEDELGAIDAWGVPEGMSSRAEAVRQLISRGLRAADPGARNEDADVGLPGKPAPSASAILAHGEPDHADR